MREEFISKADILFLSYPKEMKDMEGWTEKPRQLVKIKWTYEHETRSWGIKSQLIIVPDQIISVVIVNEEDEEKTIDVHLTNVSVTREASTGSIFPEQILRDFKGNFIVTF